MNDRAVFIDHADAFNAFLLADVLNDLASDVTLVHQHRITRTRDNHVGNLCDMPGNLTLQFFFPVFNEN